MSWVAAAVVGGAVVGSVATSSAAGKAADAQVQAAQESSDVQERMFGMQMELLEPFRDIGVDVGLPGLQQLSTPEGQAQFLQEYYAGPEYDIMSSQARAQQLASAEATGGLGSTSTQNQLGRIAPTLGMQAIGQQRDMYGQLANIGLSGAGSQAGYAGQYGQNISALQGQMGAAQAGAYLQQGQAMGNIGQSIGTMGMLYGMGAF